jgi:hypothetical protein
MSDRVQVIVTESAALGGDPADEDPNGVPHPLNPQEDVLEAAGVYFQSPTARDEQVHAKRDAGDNLVLTDPVAGSKTLNSLLDSTKHAALRQLIHLADADGPMEGFASGAYLETLPAADPFPTSFIWWESAAKTQKIVEETVTYNANKTINTDQWKAYAEDGTTLLVTVTDTIAYSGVFETSRTRVIT